MYLFVCKVYRVDPLVLTSLREKLLLICSVHRTFLKDLIECTHLFLKMLEAQCKSNKHMMVQKKIKKHARKKPGAYHLKLSTPNPRACERITNTQWGLVGGFSR